MVDEHVGVVATAVHRVQQSGPRREQRLHRQTHQVGPGQAQPPHERAVDHRHPVRRVEHEHGVMEVLEHGLLCDGHHGQQPLAQKAPGEPDGSDGEGDRGRVLIGERAEAEDVRDRSEDREEGEHQGEDELVAVTGVVTPERCEQDADARQEKQVAVPDHQEEQWPVFVHQDVVRFHDELGPQLMVEGVRHRRQDAEGRHDPHQPARPRRPLLTLRVLDDEEEEEHRDRERTRIADGAEDDLRGHCRRHRLERIADAPQDRGEQQTGQRATTDRAPSRPHEHQRHEHDPGRREQRKGVHAHLPLHGPHVMGG